MEIKKVGYKERVSGVSEADKGLNGFLWTVRNTEMDGSESHVLNGQNK